MHRSSHRSSLCAAIALSLLILTPAAPADEASPTGTLITHIEGLTSSDGKLRFVLFDSEENFLKRPVRAEIIDIEDGRGKWVVEDLPYGVYAVLVHHDVNGNGKMERHWYGKPKEPSGVSNDAPARFGPPKYRKAKFLFESETLELTITVR